MRSSWTLYASWGHSLSDEERRWGVGRSYRREPAKVLLDILDGCVSLENAQRDYGVVVDPVLYRIDEEKNQCFTIVIKGSGLLI